MNDNRGSCQHNQTEPQTWSGMLYRLFCKLCGRFLDEESYDYNDIQRVSNEYNNRGRQQNDNHRGQRKP